MDEKEAEKKRSLRNKLKADRTSETEEQRKESLRIRREKDRARRRTKGKKRSPNTDDYEKSEVKLTYDWGRWSLANSLGWPWRQKKNKTGSF